MGIKYTSTPYSKANLTAILAIPRSELPNPASGLYPLLTAIDTGDVYKFDPDSTTIGTLPTGASGAGRWIAISSVPINISSVALAQNGTLQLTGVKQVLGVFEEITSGVTYSKISPSNMTSNTSNSPFVASSSTQFSEFYGAFRVFDNVITSEPDFVTDTFSGFVGLLLGSVGQAVVRYLVFPSDVGVQNSQSPKSWTFEGSNDGTNWTVLNTQTNQTTWVTNTAKTFTFSNAIAYTNYRLNVSTNVAGSGLLRIGEMELYTSLGGATYEKKPTSDYKISFITDYTSPVITKLSAGSANIRVYFI